MAKGRKWFGSNYRYAAEQESGTVSVDAEKNYSMEEIFDLAYQAYRESAASTDLLNRGEFRENMWPDQSVMKHYLDENVYHAYLNMTGTQSKSDDAEESYIPENNPDASDEALEVMSEKLENSVNEILSEEAELPHNEGMLMPEPDYGNTVSVPQVDDSESEEDYKETVEDTSDSANEQEEDTTDNETAQIEDVTPLNVPEYPEDYDDSEKEDEESYMEGNEMQEVTASDLTADDLEYIFSNKELMSKLRQSVYHAPDDTSMDDELRKMNLDELFEQLLRINGVTRKIPAIIENVHQLYLKRIEDAATEIPRERLEGFLLYAIELIREYNHMEYGEYLNKYLVAKLGMTMEEIDKLDVADGPGGYERVVISIDKKDKTLYYEIEAPFEYDQAKKTFLKYQMCASNADIFVDPIVFFESFGITICSLDEEPGSHVILFNERGIFEIRPNLQMKRYDANPLA